MISSAFSLPQFPVIECVGGLKACSQRHASSCRLDWTGILRCPNHQRPLILRLDVTGAGSGFRRNMASDSAQGVSVSFFLFFEDEAGSKTIAQILFI